MANPLLAPLLRWLGRLSYPRLFLLAAVLFVADVAVPDFIPFADELLLGLGTLLLANWKNRKAGAQEGPIEGDLPRR
ncbi:hypothetical protein MQC88_01450 [Luteimonas sp. 50]|uniref:Transmembrane protein n=1 Tax=Cognatiluteimonas sedimenti TaxID=2927791 RepID=A0ABT0A0Y6_9GAMM|nr:DUF6116 family protein [Lysobacter sedimenti]MCJ0824638.1 hypothetical protein [Lysobacter sedimenti]